MPESNTTTETPSTSENKVNAVGVFENGKFIPYGYAGSSGVTGTPVYIFNTIDEYNAVSDTLPDPSLILTLDDLDTGGFKFDSELDDESENAPQTKVVKEALDALRRNPEIKIIASNVPCTEGFEIPEEYFNYPILIHLRYANASYDCASGILTPREKSIYTSLVGFHKDVGAFGAFFRLDDRTLTCESVMSLDRSTDKLDTSTYSVLVYLN